MTFWTNVMTIFQASLNFCETNTDIRFIFNEESYYFGKFRWQ